jgi:hypothetical protein
LFTFVNNQSKKKISIRIPDDMMAVALLVAKEERRFKIRRPGASTES